ncbi:YQGE family putative transporter [Pullulanibacillus pueri]|uniref:Major facilitator superfamily (MFS) profile domain-containing protein n=1 Tax=Pullulanibacillus pueri TaxID=1437324 RepID=A0A8J3ELK7_9BACL|nr:MFS transporter [Pullulanibacillus pueri]MBM7681533.1 YQGE family putative transporter [Pullulanibacillus pueri]GGH79776.1 hypothetical protein GCM10007096_15210 [Pullulanibacillus pueri]
MKALRIFFNKKDIPRDLLLLLVISGLYFLGIALSNTFVNVFLWKHTNSFFNIGLYNLMIVIFQPLTFLLAGRWAKKIDRVIVLRLGVIFLALFFITVLLFGSYTQDYLLLFGAVLGVGYGFYWLAFNVLTFEITEPDTRDFFNGFQGILSSLGGMIGPIFAGWVIASMTNYTGYKIIFGISLALFAIAIITSWFLKRRPAEGSFTFRRIIAERKHNSNWKDILYAHFFQGIREGTFAFVITIWVFMTTKSEFALGKFGLIESAIMFISFYLVSRLVKPHHRKMAILIGGLLLYASVFIIIFKLTFPLLIFFAITVSFALPLLSVPYMSLTFDVIGRGWKAAEMRIEYIVVRELFYNGGRIVSILLFLLTLAVFKNNEDGIRFLMMAIGAGHLAIYFCIRNIHFTTNTDDDAREEAEEAKRFHNGESGSTV